MRDSASVGELSRFAFQECRRVENYACLSQRCVGPELADELEAIHRRHKNIGNHEIGMLDAGFCQAFRAIRGFQDAIKFITQHRLDEFAVGRMIVHD